METDTIAQNQVEEVFERLKQEQSWLRRHEPLVVWYLRNGIASLFRRDWLEVRINWHRLTERIMWYVRAIYAPYNRMKIRNVWRRYSCDHDCLMFHAAFTVLCCHIEHSHGGRTKFAEEVAWRLADTGQRDNWGKAQQTMLDCYDWYIKVDWEEPIPFPKNGTQEEQEAWARADDEFYKIECNNRMKSLVEVRGYMWT